jgi:radical SAM protein with 4Fe4S-binding SPASM domain
MNHQLQQLKNTYDIVGIIDLDSWNQSEYQQSQEWLEQSCRQLYKESYTLDQRIIFTITKEIYVKNQSLGLILRNLQVTLNECDITNSFVIVVSTNPNLDKELNYVKNISKDTTSITGIHVEGSWTTTTIDKFPATIRELYKYGSENPIKVNLNDLSEKEQFLLTKSKVFCIYPWIHINANPDGKAYPCCMTDHKYPVGNCNQNSLKEIWNNNSMRGVRKAMLSETSIDGCKRCYEQEQAGFFSGRQNANKHHGHHIGKVLETQEDGTFNSYEMVYWDIRFSNLCNLRCRSCGHIYSSQWYQDQAKIAGPIWAKNNKVLNISGRYDMDMWQQLKEHIDYVEQIYFAGGEPIIMEEHYRILDELEGRGKFDVRLIYNTNFTEVKLKNRCVFDYWKKFDSVSVGASLDAMGPRAEYIRKGTHWDDVERNREKMLEICPNVDFYISPTLSILNAMHLPEFHRNWVERGLIKAQDLNVNILLDPLHYRIDIAPDSYKAKLKSLYGDHIQWIKSQGDHLGRATKGFESAVNFMNSADNTKLIPKFWQVTNQLDAIRNESCLDIIPELAALK